MEQLASAEFWVALGQIIAINVLLSGDNAVIIALASRRLPVSQRNQGLFWGAAGAIVLRLVLTYFVVLLLRLPYVKVIGGAFLLWIGVKLRLDESSEPARVPNANRMLDVLRIIVVADFVMSLDNVIGVAAIAKDSLLLLVTGLATSIPLIVWGSQIILKILDRIPSLVIVGAALLGYVAGKVAVADPLFDPWLGVWPWLSMVAPVVCMLLVIGMGEWLSRRTSRPSMKE